MSKPLLSVVLPLRCTAERPYFYERAVRFLKHIQHHPQVELLVVDSGSEYDLAQSIRDLCSAQGVGYWFLPTGNEPFSIGEARDHGAQHATGDCVTFLDVDLAVSGEFFDRVLNQIEQRKMFQPTTEFFLIPCLYLREAGNAYFMSLPKEEQFAEIQRLYLKGNSRYIEFYAPSSSVMVVNRHHYLACGGHRPEFRTHGAEDFELIHRLAAKDGRFDRPDNYYTDLKTYEDGRYEGFRALYSLYGHPQFAEGIFVVHLWHPRGKVDPRSKERATNDQLLNRFMHSFDESGEEPPALADLSNSKKTLIFGRPTTGAMNVVRQALPKMGELVFRPESEFAGVEDMVNFISREGIDRIFSFNPFGNAKRLELYRGARKAQIPFIVFERGGLPDSWFFDYGFNADSPSYDPLRWDRSLTAKQRQAALEYKDELCSQDRTLEKNGPRVGAGELRAKLGLVGKKVLFVPLQRPGDTVTRYFNGDAIEGVVDFCRFVEKVAQQAQELDWIVVAKKHPLERDAIPMEGVLYLEEYVHIHDAIEMADCLLLMNSGVGLLSMIMETPCLYVSETYYGHKSLNRKVSTISEVMAALKDPPRVDHETMLRFLHYLRFNLYSYGSASTHLREEADGSLMTITTAVDFRELRLPGEEPVCFAPKAQRRDGREYFSQLNGDQARRNLLRNIQIQLGRNILEPEPSELLNFKFDVPRLIEGMPQEHTLAVILPVRLSEERPDVLQRLDFVDLDRKRPECVHFCVVDDGSDPKYIEPLREKCAQKGFAYIRLDTQSRMMAIGRARNAGAMYMPADYVMFQDVDLMPYHGFYQGVLDELMIQGADTNSEKFVMYGVIYLSEEGTERFLSSPERLRKERFIQALLDNDSKVVEKFSTATSVVALSRHAYLMHGGNDEDFEGWGFEDIEWACRAIRRMAKYPLPEKFGEDYKIARNITEYRGFKAIQRLFGDMTFQRGHCLFHAWHPVLEASDYQKKGRARNRWLFEKKMNDYARDRIEPLGLPDGSAGKTLAFSTTNPFISNRKTAPYLGELVIEDETHLTPESLIHLVREQGIQRVLFFNPFGSEHRLSLYKAVRENGIPYIVAERGALRDSVFFDPHGFNAESSSYGPQHWDFPVADGKRESVRSYIEKEKETAESLEKQGSRIGASRVRSRLGIKPNQKVLFIPLQRPSDTVIQYFCGPIGTYENFIELVRQTVKSLGNEWKVVVKKHPLEDVRPHIQGAIFADEFNVKDLLEFSDAVLLINSGVGVLSMMWNKPVLYAGDVFYGHPAINRQVEKIEDVLQVLSEGFMPDQEKVERFLSYLVNDFYSFGEFTTREARWEEGGRMTVTTGIDFYQIRGLGSPYTTRKIKTPEVGVAGSVLFDRYRYAREVANEKLKKNVSHSKSIPILTKGASNSNSSPIEISDAGSTNSFVANVHNPVIKLSSAAIDPIKSVGFRERLSRRYKKFRRDPQRFFNDSRFSFLRWYGRLRQGIN